MNMNFALIGSKGKLVAEGCLMDGHERRILRIEQTVPTAKKKREETLRAFTSHARLHATAIAAIVKVGEPKIDEPLSCAWKRTLDHYEIRPGDKMPAVEMPPRLFVPPDWVHLLPNIENVSPADRHFINQIWPWGRLDDQERAAARLTRVCVGSEGESAKFTQLFSAAPEWLLRFTGVLVFDAALLKFDLPKLTWMTMKWGTVGFEESQLWPLLPLGRMADGDPVSDEEVQRWRFRLYREAEEDNGNVPQASVHENEADDAESFEIVRAMRLALDLEAHPEKEKDLSRYDRLRLRKLCAWFEDADN
jgi:hypothetical protein